MCTPRTEKTQLTRRRLHPEIVWDAGDSSIIHLLENKLGILKDKARMKLDYRHLSSGSELFMWCHKLLLYPSLMYRSSGLPRARTKHGEKTLSTVVDRKLWNRFPLGLVYFARQKIIHFWHCVEDLSSNCNFSRSSCLLSSTFSNLGHIDIRKTGIANFSIIGVYKSSVIGSTVTVYYHQYYCSVS